MLLPRLVGISPQAALRLALAFSKKTPEQIEQEMGWSKSVSARVFCSGNYFPAYRNIPKFCDVIGNNILILWLFKNRKYPAYDQLEPMDALALLQSMGSFLKEMGDASCKAQEALKDWNVSQEEARNIIKEVRDVIEVGCYIMSRLWRVIDEAAVTPSPADIWRSL